MKSSLFLYLFWLLLTSRVIPCSAGPSDAILDIGNGLLELGFDRSTGRLLIIRDHVHLHDYLEAGMAGNSLWRFVLSSSDGLDTLDMESGSYTFHYKQPTPHSLELQWDQGGDLDPQDKCKITAMVSLVPDKALSTWKISIEGPRGKNIDGVSFPIVSGIVPMDQEYLAVPSWMGMLVKEPRAHLANIPQVEKKVQWSYPGPLSLQCLALYDPDRCGLYFSCNDTLGFMKSFSFSLDDHDNLTYAMHHYPSLVPRPAGYTPGYEAVIGSFEGDWITAAMQYRDWSSGQRWCRESRLTNALVPPWLEETALWVWNRGRSPFVLEPATELRQQLGLPVSVSWHWWHGCAYDIGFPEYLPPREGRESFARAVEAARKKDVRCIVYMNHFQWGNATASWKEENAGYYAVKDRNGAMHTHVFNIFTGLSLTNMCIATDFWQNKYASLCDTVVNIYGVSGVYMDQACISRACYDEHHGHPPGGGNFWNESFVHFTRLIRSKLDPADQPILTGEGALELRIPDLDAFLTLQVSRERYMGQEEWETIPFFQAVYHPYAITYGNYSSLVIPPYDELWPEEFAPEEPQKLLDRGFQKQFLMEQARSFVWGMQPTIANYRSSLLSEREEEMAYLLKLARVRNRALKYLLHGEFLRSPPMEIPEEGIRLSRLSIYKGREEHSVTTFYKKVPMVYSGTWRSDDGRIGIALASIGDDPYHVRSFFPCRDYELPTSGRIYKIDAEGRTLLSEYQEGMVRLDFTLGPKDLCLVEIVSDK